MTRIEFHFNAPERLQYACRYSRKAYANDCRVGVVGSEAVLRQLDAALWRLSDVDFLPHCTASDGPELQAASAIHLSTDAGQFAGLPMLVNLGDEVPVGFERFERLIEIVPTDDHGKMTARQRWRHYAAQGFELTQHDLSKVSVS